MPSSKRSPRPRQSTSSRPRKGQEQVELAALVREIRALLRTMEPQESKRPRTRRR